MNFFLKHYEILMHIGSKYHCQFCELLPSLSSPSASWAVDILAWTKGLRAGDALSLVMERRRRRRVTGGAGGGMSSVEPAGPAGPAEAAEEAAWGCCCSLDRWCLKEQRNFSFSFHSWINKGENARKYSKNLWMCLFNIVISDSTPKLKKCFSSWYI